MIRPDGRATPVWRPLLSRKPNWEGYPGRSEVTIMQKTSSLDAIRRAIAEHLAYQSEWRGQKAEEYPEDDRNARAAADLAELAAQAEQLPADNDNLRALDLLMDELEETDPYVFLSFHDALGRDVTSSLHVWWTLPGGRLARGPSIGEVLEVITTATARSYAENFRLASEEPGFVQPSAHLVAMIEALAGEPIWREEDD